ncbi:caspase-7-like [Drosophila tropicalis]|uniref:caspase-7-like n=1 Tax=Drosophila tropicalis TaxID=46794 RepID=UPI0035AB940D
MSQLKPAKVLILNHEKFEERLMQRIGRDKDVQALVRAFNIFNCNVEVVNDATVKEVREEVQKLRSANFEEHSALVLVVLSHGDKYDNIMAKDSVYSLDNDVLLPILKNDTLKDKPKLFIVQTSRKGHIGGSESYSIEDDKASQREVYKCFSTSPGNVSLRHVTNGTVFIQTFCQALERDGETKEIDAIMMEVRSTVEELTHALGHQQIPSETNTMTKKYVFGEHMDNFDLN